jgi:hypothetical protein
MEGTNSKKKKKVVVVTSGHEMLGSSGPTALHKKKLKINSFSKGCTERDQKQPPNPL